MLYVFPCLDDISDWTPPVRWLSLPIIPTDSTPPMLDGFGSVCVSHQHTGNSSDWSHVYVIRRLPTDGAIVLVLIDGWRGEIFPGCGRK